MRPRKGSEAERLERHPSGQAWPLRPGLVLFSQREPSLLGKLTHFEIIEEAMLVPF